MKRTNTSFLLRDGRCSLHLSLSLYLCACAHNLYACFVSALMFHIHNLYACFVSALMFHILYGVCGIAATNVVEPGAGLRISFHLKFLPFSFVVVADI
jgi:hypothetical protein